MGDVYQMVLTTQEQVGFANDLDEELDSEGIIYFRAIEFLKMRKVGGTLAFPPGEYLRRIIRTAKLGQLLREEMGVPLRVGNGYRPTDYNKAVGGAKNSQHIYFRAADFDLFGEHDTQHNRRRLYEAAVELHLTDRAKFLKMGLGLYSRHGGRRVHIDTGHRYRYWGGLRGSWYREIRKRVR